MKKRFIVVTNRTTAEQDKAFQESLPPGFAWWHWLGETWLLVDNTGFRSASELRDIARDAFPGIYCLVIEVSESGDRWAGFGPSSGEKNMFAWIRDYWQTSR